MTGGLNLLVNIRRQSAASDDDIGGANVTGTFIYEALPASIRQNMPTQVQLAQGLEAAVSYSFTVSALRAGQTITLYEKDEVRVTAPLNHPYINQDFRITGVNISYGRPGRSRIHGTLRRTKQSRREHF